MKIWDFIVVDVDQDFAKVDFVATNNSNSTLSLHCGKHSDSVLGRNFFSFSFKISMTDICFQFLC